MIDYLEIEKEVYPLRFSYKVITKHMTKVGLKKFVELEKFINEIPTTQMQTFVYDAIVEGCKKLDQKAPDVDWFEDNIDFAHITRALEVFGKQMGGNAEEGEPGKKK